MSERTIQDAKTLNRRSKTLIIAANRISQDFHDHLMNLVVHVQAYGDVTPVEYFIGGLPISMRTTTMEAWLAKYTPITKTKDKWHLKKNWTKADFKIEKMEDNPFWSLGREAKVKTFSIDAMLKTVVGWQAKVKRYSEKTGETGEEWWAGDAEQAEAIVVELAQAFKERIARLTPAQRGEVKPQTQPTASITNLPVAHASAMPEAKAA